MTWGRSSSGPVDARPQVEARLAPGPWAPAQARRLLDGLRTLVHPSLLYDLRLLVTELVTNSVRHAGLGPEDWIEVRVEVDRDATRVEVSDTGGGFVARARPDPGLGQGWGLYLLDRLSDQWGTSTDDTSRVWFELRS